MERSVKVRLEEKANELFSRYGYSVTTVRDVMDAAKVVPRSFYDTFKSKKELGLQYLLRKEEESMKDLQLLMNQYSEPKQLFRAWVISKKRQIKKKEFFGCPFLRFAMQMPEVDKEFQSHLRSVSLMWQNLICNYLNEAIRLGHLNKKVDTKSMTRQALAVYEGNIAMWRISGDSFYLDQMTVMFEKIVH